MNSYEITRDLVFKLGMPLTVVVFLSAGCGKKAVVDFGPQNTQVISTTAPEAKKSAPPLTLGLDDSLENVINWYPMIDRELGRLGNYVETVVNKSSVKSDFTAPELVYFGLDRESSAKTFEGNQIQVTRWRRGDTAPSASNSGLESLIGNLYEPWLSTTRFRTELTAHKVSRESDELTVLVIARTKGQITDETGLASTSMWTTKFKVVSGLSGKIDLTELTVSAHEEISFSAGAGSLFRDVTANVLRRDDSMSTQLGHSLDTWARWIPGIDISGHQGIAIGDSNNDGLEDIYVCQPHGLPNLLLQQNPDGTAENVAHLINANILDESRAALFVDLDNDGDQDLVVSTKRELILLSNSGRGEFQLEHRLLAGYDGGSLSAADYDNDGDLDLYVCKFHSILHEEDLFPHPSDFSQANDGGRNVLLRNNEGWNFEDVTESAGLRPGNNRYSRSAIWTDIDLDGDQDLYVANEFSEDVLYENNEGWFSRRYDTENALKDKSSSRSVSVGDFNADGRPDFFVAANALPEAQRVPEKEVSVGNQLARSFLDSRSRESRVLYSNQQKDQLFTSYRLPSPIFSTRSAFASVNLDINNDGFEDLMMTNGVLTRTSTGSTSVEELNWLRQIDVGESFGEGGAKSDRVRFESVTRTLADEIRQGKSFGEAQRNVCLLGMGQVGFADFSPASGIDRIEDARGVATVDWDHDGDLDVVTSSRTAPQLRIFANSLQSDNQFIAFKLQGTTSNRDAIGARVEVHLSGRKLPMVKTVTAGSGAHSQSSKILHLGIPKKEKVEKAVLHWPSGLEQTFLNVKPNVRYFVKEGDVEPAALSNSRFDIELFKPVEEKSVEPLQMSRSIFYPPTGIPSLEFQSDRKAWIRLKSIDRMPVFVVFLDGSMESKDILKSLTRESKEIAKLGVDVVAIQIDGENPNSTEHYASIEKMVADTEYPFRFGAASESMLDKLKLLYGEWYSDQNIPKGPFAWLMDKDDMVRIVYPAGEVRPDRMMSDLTLISGGLRNTSKRVSPLGGVWMGSTPTVNYSRLATRFEELGYIVDGERFSDLSRPYLANQVCRSAFELHSQGEFVLARSEFASAMDLDPQCEMACVEYGKFLVLQSEKETDELVRNSLLADAQVWFEKAIQLDPGNTQAILGRADVAKHRFQIEEAIGQLENYLEINPTRWEVHAIIGRLHFRKKKYVEATSHLLKAYKNRPTLPFVAGDLGFLYLNGGLYEEARSFLKVGNQLQPSAPDLKRHLAQAEFLTGNYEPAIDLMREVIALQPNETTPKFMLAWLLATSPYESLRDGEKSLEMAQSLVKIYDDLASSCEVCAAAYAEVGDFENARLMQRKAVDLIESGGTPEVYSERQKEGLNIRMNLYQRGEAYLMHPNMADFDQIPIRQPGT